MSSSVFVSPLLQFPSPAGTLLVGSGISHEVPSAAAAPHSVSMCRNRISDDDDVDDYAGGGAHAHDDDDNDGGAALNVSICIDAAVADGTAGHTEVASSAHHPIKVASHHNNAAASQPFADSQSPHHPATITPAAVLFTNKAPDQLTRLLNPVVVSSSSSDDPQLPPDHDEEGAGSGVADETVMLHRVPLPSSLDGNANCIDGTVTEKEVAAVVAVASPSSDVVGLAAFDCVTPFTNTTSSLSDPLLLSAMTAAKVERRHRRGRRDCGVLSDSAPTPAGDDGDIYAETAASENAFRQLTFGDDERADAGEGGHCDLLDGQSHTQHVPLPPSSSALRRYSLECSRPWPTAATAHSSTSMAANAFPASFFERTAMMKTLAAVAHQGAPHQSCPTFSAIRSTVSQASSSPSAAASATSFISVPLAFTDAHGRNLVLRRQLTVEEAEKALPSPPWTEGVKMKMEEQRPVPPKGEGSPRKARRTEVRVLSKKEDTDDDVSSESESDCSGDDDARDDAVHFGTTTVRCSTLAGAVALATVASHGKRQRRHDSTASSSPSSYITPLVSTMEEELSESSCPLPLSDAGLLEAVEQREHKQMRLYNQYAALMRAASAERSAFLSGSDDDGGVHENSDKADDDDSDGRAVGAAKSTTVLTMAMVEKCVPLSLATSSSSPKDPCECDAHKAASSFAERKVRDTAFLSATNVNESPPTARVGVAADEDAAVGSFSGFTRADGRMLMIRAASSSTASEE